MSRSSVLGVRGKIISKVNAEVDGRHVYVEPVRIDCYHSITILE